MSARPFVWRLRLLALVVVTLFVACGGIVVPPPPDTVFEGCAPKGDLAQVEPQLTCVLDEAGARTAVFGYDNKSTATVTATGANNRFEPELDPRLYKGATQPPTAFEPGTHSAVFSVTFSPSFGGVTWRLGARMATTASGAPACTKYGPIGGAYFAGTDPGHRIEIYRDPEIVAATAIQPTVPSLPGRPNDPTPLTVGATKGTFSVGDDGSARYHIPLQLPDGRAGVQPTLGLGYSSQGDAGILGVGWTLSGVASISRCGKVYGRDGSSTPVSFTDNRFCLDGDPIVGDLSTGAAPLHDPYTRIRVGTYDALGPVTFVVERPNGRVLVFGAGDNATLEGGLVELDPSGHELPRQTLPDPNARLTWFIASERDRSFNMVRYHYEDVNRLAAPGCETGPSPCYAYEKRIASITYTHRGVLTTAQATRRVVFTYDTARKGSCIQAA